MDCTPTNSYEDCDGHPLGSHRGGCSVDTGYYTYGITNITQSSRVPELVTHLWKNGGFDEQLFDWERNYVFFTRLKGILPKAVIRMDKRISYDYMEGKIREKYGLGAWNSWWKIITHDSPGQCRHHTHVHVTLERPEYIDWKYNIRQWRKAA